MPFHFILPEEPPTFPVFTCAVLHHWGVLMSGCGLTVLIGIIEKFSGKDIPFSVYIAVLILFVFIACFLAWIDAREEMARLNLELAKKEQELLNKDEIVLDKNTAIIELKKELLETKEKQMPQLSAVFEQIFAADVLENGENFSAVTLRMAVRNLGMPSAATDWLPSVSINQGEFQTFQGLHPLEELRLGYGNNNETYVIKEEDMIYEKTAIPIQTGNIVIGFLHFRTHFTSSEILAKGTVIKVSFRDVKQNLCETSYECGQGEPLLRPTHTPGVKTKIISFPENGRQKK